MNSSLDTIWRIWKQWRCEHFWRPGRVETKMRPGYVEYTEPVKVCDYCKKIVYLDIGRFYAEFGRMPW